MRKTILQKDTHNTDTQRDPDTPKKTIQEWKADVQVIICITKKKLKQLYLKEIILKVNTQKVNAQIYSF